MEASTPLVVAACILVLMVALMMSRTVPCNECFRADAGTVLEATVRGSAAGASVKADKDPNTAAFYTGSPEVSLQVTHNDVVLLPRHAFNQPRQQRVLVDLVNPYQILLTNTLTFPTLIIDPFVPSNGSVTEDKDFQRCYVYGAGRTQLRNYINTAIPRVGYSLKLVGGLKDIEPHNVARSPQDTLMTPEAPKFADMIGVTVLLDIVDPDDFAVSFLIRKPGRVPTYVTLAARGADLKLMCIHHGWMKTRNTRDSMSLGDAHRNQWVKQGVNQIQTFKDALLGASGAVSVKLEVTPGRARCFVEGSSFRRAYVIVMDGMLNDADNLRTDKSHPPQMAWRATNGKVRIFPFPLGDLSMDDVDVVKKA